MRPRKLVLYVDSSEHVRSVNKFVLENARFRVIACATTGEALAYLNAETVGKVDVLMADIRLEDMDGNALARFAKQKEVELPVILFSRTENDQGRETHSNANVFLSKGLFTSTEMIAHAKTLCRKKRGPKCKPTGIA